MNKIIIFSIYYYKTYISISYIILFLSKILFNTPYFLQILVGDRIPPVVVPGQNRLVDY